MTRTVDAGKGRAPGRGCAASDGAAPTGNPTIRTDEMSASGPRSSLVANLLGCNDRDNAGR